MAFVPVTHCFPLMSLEEKSRYFILHNLADSGIKNIVLGSSVMLESVKDPFLPEKLLDGMNKAGIAFVDAHAHFPDPVCPSYPIEEKRSFMLQFIKMEIEITASFGVKTLTLHTGNNFDRSLPLDVYKNALLRSMDELVPYAEKKGIILALENIWTTPNTPEVLLEVVKKIDSPFLGLCYDSGHANIMKYARQEGSPARLWWNTAEEIPQDDAILEKMLPYVVNCHLHDNMGNGDSHKLPGEGNIPWDHIMGLLKKAPRLQCIQNESSFYTQSSVSFREVADIFEDLCKKGGC